MADQRADHRRKLEEMKKVLVTDEDFGRVYRIFFDEVACHRSFMALGKKEKSPLLKTTLRLVGESLFGSVLITVIGTNLVDKIVTALLVWGILRGLPTRTVGDWPFLAHSRA